jgi:hypothetical protein
MKRTLKISIFFLFFLLLNVSSGQKIKVRTVSGGLGISIPEWKWGIGITPEAELGLGEVVTDIYLHPFFSFWYNSYAQDNIRLSLKQLLWGVKLLYYLDYKYEGPYGGAGFSYHLLYPDHLKKHAISHTYYKQESVETRVGLFVVAGFIFKYKKYRPYIESKFYLLPGDYSAFQLLGGVLHKF